MSQYKEDEKRFVELFSKFTGIRQEKLEAFLQDNPVNLIMEHTDLMEITPIQREKLKALRELKNIYGTMKSSTRQYTLNSDEKAGAYFLSYFADIKEKEHFACSFLNTKHQVIATKILSTGSVSETAVYPREIVKAALMHDANSVIVAHNHPSGNPEPSQADLELTKNLCVALATVRIKMVDHIIAGSGIYVSFTERGLLENRAVEGLNKVAGTREIEGYFYGGKNQNIPEKLYAFANQREGMKLKQLLEQAGEGKDQYIEAAMSMCSKDNNFTTAGYLLRNGADFEKLKSTWSISNEKGQTSAQENDFFKRMERYHIDVIGKHKKIEPLELKRGKSL